MVEFAFVPGRDLISPVGADFTGGLMGSIPG